MEASSRRTIDQTLVAKVVSSYVRKNRLSPADMPALINTVYQSLLALGKPPQLEPPTPAVPIRRSVSLDYVVCLECGWRGLSLRRHIRERHGLSADEYRTRWKLPLHHALVAPAYSERRSEIAKHSADDLLPTRQFDQDGGEEKPCRTPVPSQGDRETPTRYSTRRSVPICLAENQH
jgi:predicted transcriptional regulator